MGRKPNVGDTITVKLGRKLHKDVQTLAAFYGDGKVGPWLTKFLEPIVEKEMARLSESIRERTNQERERRK